MTNQEIKLRLIEAYIKCGTIRGGYNFDHITKEVDKLLEYINKDIINNKSKEEQLKKIYFDFYDQMEEPERSEAKENYDYQCAKIESVPTDIYPARCLGFSWNETKQCYEYWSIINNKYDK